MALLKRYLKRHTHSLLSLTEQALGQLIKGCEMAIASAILLTSENNKVYIENQRQKKKRVKKRTYIARGGILLGVEGASRAQTAQEGAVEGAAEAAVERPQRAVRKCSMCTSTKYTVRTCLRRQISI